MDIKGKEEELFPPLIVEGGGGGLRDNPHLQDLRLYTEGRREMGAPLIRFYPIQEHKCENKQPLDLDRCVESCSFAHPKTKDTASPPPFLLDPKLKEYHWTKGGGERKGGKLLSEAGKESQRPR